MIFRSQIFGMMSYPCSTTLQEHKKTWWASEFYTSEHFESAYYKHLVALQHIAECAKIFILDNYQKVTDWSGLDVNLKDKNGNVVKYFNYVPRPPVKEGQVRSAVAERIREKHDVMLREMHNPITSITDVVLDTTDGDMAMTINGTEHWRIDQEAAVIIADYIEKQLIVLSPKIK